MIARWTARAALAAGLSAPASGLWAEPAVTVASQVAGVMVVGLDNLPPAPPAGEGREACQHLLVEATETPAGQAVAARGWGVTGEVPFGGLTAVSFVGGYEPATSGTCTLRAGNVGLFSGADLVALVYAADDGTPLIARVVRFGDGGARILSGDLLPVPVADLRRIGPAGLAVTPPAPAEPVCRGAGSVPLIDGLPIDLARILLTQAGWQPVPGAAEPTPYGQAPQIAAAGVVEVQDCSGTGYGFCGYAYSGPAGELAVTTAGEIEPETGRLPFVVGYGVTCRDAP